MTLSDLALRLQWSPAYLSQIERGKRKPPSVWHIDMLANILGVDPYKLLGLVEKESGKLKIFIGRLSYKKKKMVLYFVRFINSISNEDAEKIISILRRRG